MAGSAGAQYLNPGPDSSTTPIRLIGDDDSFPEASVSSLAGTPSISSDGQVVARASTTFFDFTNFETVRTDRFYGGDPASPGVVLAEGTGTTTTTALGSGRLNAAGQLGYSAKLSTGAQFEPDGIFLDDTLLVAESTAVPLSAGVNTGAQFDDGTSGLRFVDIAEDGDVFFLGTFTTSETLTGSAPGSPLDGRTGAVIDQAIFRYDSQTGDYSTLLKSGDTLTNPIGSDLVLGPAEIQPSGSSDLDIQPLGAVRVSDSGSNYITEVDVDPNINIQINLDPDPSVAEPNGITRGLVLNNSFLTTSAGTLIQDDEVYANEVGGGGDPVRIRDLGSFDVNDSGDYAVVIEIGNPEFQNDGDDPDYSELLLINGQEVFRNLSPSESITSVTINNQGDVAFIYDESIIVNGNTVLAPGDSTDNGSLFDLTGGIALSDRDANESATLALQARTNVTGGTNRAFFTMELDWPSVLLGDYNGDGEVNAADYTVWADNFGSMVDLEADGNGNGVIDAADYTVWADNFGNTLPGQAAVTFIPEPATAGLIALGGLVMLRRPRSA
ncbi:MAG: hypothetical protein AAF911_04120 [Planctomycetota bacterium]